jgi:predicted nucleic acid-binding protein
MVSSGAILAHCENYVKRFQESAEQARVALTDLLTFLSVVAVEHDVIEQALNLPYPDFEDAVQMMAAVGSGAQYLVTRNIQDYSRGPLPVLQPVELLALI